MSSNEIGGFNRKGFNPDRYAATAKMLKGQEDANKCLKTLQSIHRLREDLKTFIDEKSRDAATALTLRTQGDIAPRQDAAIALKAQERAGEILRLHKDAEKVSQIIDAFKARDTEERSE